MDKVNERGESLNKNVAQAKVICPHCEYHFEVPSEVFIHAITSCPSCKTTFQPMKELANAAWERTKTPEFQEALKASISGANKGITHAEFVTGMQNKTIGFKCLLGEPCQLIRGVRKAIFSILVLLYMVAPLIFVPLWSYHESNWWLLIGVGVSKVATRVAVRSLYYSKEKMNLLGGFLLFACIGFWVFLGIHNCITFFMLCALWGYMLFHMAESVQRKYAMQSLIESPELFNEAVAQNKIMIVRRDDENTRDG